MNSDSITTVKLIRGLAYNLYRSTLCNGPPLLKRLHQELCYPVPGDLVTDVSIPPDDASDPRKSIGTLLRVSILPRMAFPDSEVPVYDSVCVVRLDFMNGVEQQWTNARLIKVKHELFDE